MNPIRCPINRMALSRQRLRPALYDGHANFSYAELDEAIIRMTSRLKAARCKAGVKIALWTAPVPEFVIVYFALLRIGCVICLVNTKRPQNIVEAELTALGCRKMLLPDTEKICLTKLIRIPWEVPERANETVSQRGRIMYQADIPANILHTSGSSGRPKAVALSVGNHYYSALGSNRHIPLTGHDAWLVSLPFYHVSGLSILWRSFLAGAAVVLVGQNRGISTCLRLFPITHMSLVPVQLQVLLRQHSLRGRLKELKAVLLGGSAVPPEVLRSAVLKKIPIYASYGLTEMSSQVATTARLRHLRDFTKARVLPYRKVQISKGEEICVCGKTLCLGFIQGGRLHKVVDSKGWYHTGDRGRIDKKGRLEVLGRLDLMFISGGENIYPEEIERTLLSFPEIAAAVVVPVPCATFGCRPVACVQFISGSRLTSAQLRSRLSSHLEKFKMPDVFYHWPKDLKRDSLKIDRRALGNLILTSGRPLK